MLPLMVVWGGMGSSSTSIRCMKNMQCINFRAPWLHCVIFFCGEMGTPTQYFLFQFQFLWVHPWHAHKNTIKEHVSVSLCQCWKWVVRTHTWHADYHSGCGIHFLQIICFDQVFRKDSPFCYNCCIWNAACLRTACTCSICASSVAFVGAPSAGFVYGIFTKYA